MVYKDKVVLVTGAGRGIGQSVACMYAAEGAYVIIAERDVEAGINTENIILKAGGLAKFIRTDVSAVADIERLMSWVGSELGRIDVLINNAGFGIFKPMDELSLEEWDNVINTNLRGTFLCSREAAAIMRKTGEGFIVNIASTRAVMSEPDSESYAASKGGIVALTHALAASLSKCNIRVNCISPGWIQTTDYENLRDIDHLQHYSNRVGKSEDIARLCLFLTQPGNDFINGQNIVVDGGMTKKMIYEPD